MKKQNFLTLAITAAIVLFTACSGGGGTAAKEVSLKTQEDSLNYALGLMNGISIKDSHFTGEELDTKMLSEFISSADEAFNAKSGNDDFQSGVQIGKMLKQQKEEGLEFDSHITFKEDLVLQGVINGIKSFENGMTSEEAFQYYQSAKQKHQQQHSGMDLKQFEETESAGEGN